MDPRQGSGRADARRNRARILDVAGEVFAAGGAAANTEEVARRAGVGIGTVFRHFPTKEALLHAVLVDRMGQLRDEAVARLDAEDPGRAFFDFITVAVRDAPGKLTLADALADTGTDVRAAVHEVNLSMREAFGQLLRNAQKSGAVRSDVEPAVAYALMIGTSRAAVAAELDERVVTRTLEIVFDGLRAR